MRTLAAIFSSILSRLWFFLPHQINLVLGRFLAFLWIDVFKIRRNVIKSNLDIAFPNMDDNKKAVIAKKSMQNMCRSFFDVLLIPTINESWIEKNVVFAGLDKLPAYREEGKGILFFSLHLGSGDLATAIITQKIMPMSLITKRFKSQFLDHFWFSLRGGTKTHFIDAHSKRNAFDILSSLKKGHGVVFVLDQFMGKPYGVETLFYGKLTGTAYGLALFAKKTKAPVVPIYTFWSNDGKLHINFGERIDLEPFSSDDEESYKVNATNRFNQELEKIISNHPEHWMWVHRRWKEFE